MPDRNPFLITLVEQRDGSWEWLIKRNGAVMAGGRAAFATAPEALEAATVERARYAASGE
jgi:hypothetical protein